MRRQAVARKQDGKRRGCPDVGVRECGSVGVKRRGSPTRLGSVQKIYAGDIDGIHAGQGQRQKKQRTLKHRDV